MKTDNLGLKMKVLKFLGIHPKLGSLAITIQNWTLFGTLASASISKTIEKGLQALNDNKLDIALNCAIEANEIIEGRIQNPAQNL